MFPNPAAAPPVFAADVSTASRWSRSVYVDRVDAARVCRVVIVVMFLNNVV